MTEPGQYAAWEQGRADAHRAFLSRVAAPAAIAGVTESSRRRLFFYTHALTHGGAERVVAMLASAFADAGHDVMFAVDHVSADHGITLSPRVDFVELGGGHALQLAALRRMLRQYQPHWILSALASSNIKMLTAASMAGMTGKLIMTWHGFPQAEVSLMSRIGYWLAPLNARLAAHHVCVSDALLDYMRHTGIPRDRSSRIYNPVSMAGLQMAPPPTHCKGGSTILSAGRLAPVKNFPALVQAFARIPRADTRLVILGEGPERPLIEAEAKRLGVADRVVLPGHVHDMSEWFRQADAFVLASHSESFSNVIVEALSFGLPVVVTDCGGPREILDHGRYGALVPCANVESLSQAMAAALDDDGAQAPQRRARAELFILDNAFQAYEALLRRLENKSF